ncbi:DUF7305 domain-containing protein [Solidesulfovibrio sp.]
MHSSAIDSVLRQMKRQLVQRPSGATLLWVIAAMVAIGGLGAGVTLMSPSTMQSKLAQEAGERAYYNALSGLNFVLSTAAVSQSTNINYTNFYNTLGGGVMKTYALPQGGTFAVQLNTVSVNGNSGNYEISNLIGYADPVGGAAPYAYALYGGSKGARAGQDYIVSEGGGGGGTPTGPSKYVIYSGTSKVVIDGAATVVGDIYAKSLEVEQAEIDGDIIASGDIDLDFSTKVSGLLCSSGNVVLDQSQVGGTINAAGNVTFKFDSTANSDVFSGGNIIMAGDVEIFGNANAQGGIDIGFSNQLKSNAYANKNINFKGTSATIDKNAYSGETVDLSWASKVSGVAVAKKVNVVYGSSVGSKIETTSYPPNIRPTAPTACIVESPPKVQTYSAGSANVKVDWAKTTYSTASPLAPGKYKKLELDGGSPITFTAGTYYFSAIKIGWGSTINFDVSGGDVIIFVVGTVDMDATNGIQVSSDGSTWKSMNDVDKSYAAKVYLEAHDNITLQFASNWFGTLFTTKAFSFKGSNKVIGAIASTGGSGSVNWSADIIYVPSNFAMANW